MKAALIVVALASIALGRATAGQETAAVAPDAEIRRILVERVDARRQSVGLVAGVIEPSGRRVVSYGRLAKDDARTPDGDTIFEIGSITKVFTSLLLADAAQRGEVSLADPVAKYLPASVKMAERGRAITLQDLATHTSGLPRLPANMKPRDAANPYADYSVEQLYQFLSSYQPARSTSTRIWAADCLGTCSRCARRPTTRRSCARASPRRSE